MKNDDYAPVDHDVLPMVINSQLEKMTQGLPTQFNAGAIAKAASALRADQSMLSKFFATMRVKYHNRKEIEILEAMEERVKVMSDGLALQTEFVKLQREYILATEDLSTVADDLEIQKMEKYVKKMQLAREAAMLQKEIDDLSKPPIKEGSKQEEELRRMRENLRHEQEKEREQAKARAEGAAEMDRAKREALRKLADDFKAEYGEDMFNWPRNVMEDFQNQKEDIEDTFRSRG